MMNVPTGMCFNMSGVISSTCIDHIYTVSSVGFSDHNIVAIARKTKVPKAGQKIVFQSYKSICKDKFSNDIKIIQWDRVCTANETAVALQMI